ncbi:hypothetical protein HPB50_022727 [Hyalomma asiaticum]|uniref:Uncharacterized protein n=1 Tax=Hyalomma asiaticum TaxID=266040 RepID=A0ACB7S8W2_HYAAI|nr:hypothetical protein HPB50_022727 [Hyalomma asiaticum]
MVASRKYPDVVSSAIDIVFPSEQAPNNVFSDTKTITDSSSFLPRLCGHIFPESSTSLRSGVSCSDSAKKGPLSLDTERRNPPCRTMAQKWGASELH